MNGSDAHPASTVNKITRPRYVTLDSLISSSILAGWASDPFMLPPCIVPHSRAWHLASRSLTFCRGWVVWSLSPHIVTGKIPEAPWVRTSFEPG